MGANADYLRRWTEALNRRDTDAMVEGASSDFEWVVAREHPDATTHHGIEASLEYLREWLRLMPDFKAEIEELSEHGNRALSVIRITGSGAGSGAATEVRVAIITTFRDGLSGRSEEYLDPEVARALLAAG